MISPQHHAMNHRPDRPGPDELPAADPTTRVLVTYATRMGSTEEIARAIGERIPVTVDCAGSVDVTVLPMNRVRSLAGFDAVIAGSAVYLGRWLPEARRWLHANAPELAERPTWLFQSGPCGSAGATPQQVSRPIAKLAFAIGIDLPVTFGGRLDPQKARNPFHRAVAMGPLTGDYRDWDDINDWTDSVVDQLLKHQPLANH
jgi:menaquinone-dependent protoporphyrinogen oxidase